MEYSQTLTQPNLSQPGSSQQRLSAENVISKFLGMSKTATEKDADQMVDQKVVCFVKAYFTQLSHEQRKSKLFHHAMKKGGDYLYQFNLLKYFDGEQGSHRAAALQIIFTDLETKPISVHSFVPVYNLLCAEFPKLPPEGLLLLIDDVQERLQTTENFLKRWRDCVYLLLTHISTIERVKKNGEIMSGKGFVSAQLQILLVNAKGTENFRHIVSIAKDLDMMADVDKYVSDVAFENLGNSSDRVEASWKLICVLEHVDQKLAHKIFLALCSSWIAEDPITGEILSIFPLFKRLLGDAPTLGKSFLAFIKQQRGALLSSNFGFLAVVSTCGIERYKLQMIQEIKRTYNKLWKFEEDCISVGWLKTAEVGCTAEAVRKQTTQLLDRLPDSEEYWDLFGQPLIHIGYSLVDSGPSKDVSIVEGRVVDDGSLSIFAHGILIRTLLINKCAITGQLEPLLHAIASSGSQGSALVLIDVLVEIIKKAAIEVLNNSKLLDGLFEYVCKMRRDVGVSLVRCLLPVINQRSKLRETLFRNLKNEMLNEASVGSAIPILILLLRSVSRKKCLKTDQSDTLSQSFASFSSQSLEAMGAKPAVDDAVALEIIGILKRCLTQPASTKIVLYEGIAEAASRCPSLIGPCLDLLVGHAITVPEWNPEKMVVTSKNVTVLREPLPQLAHTLEALCVESLTTDQSTATQARDDIVQKATRTLDKWVEKAVADDTHDLGIDKVSEWNPSTPAGKANFVFAKMMISLYDVLIEHVWRQYDAFKRNSDKDNLIGLLRRRSEAEEVLAEKTVRRKEAKIGTSEGTTFDVHQGEVFTSAQVIADVLKQLVPTENSGDEIGDVKSDLFEWCLERAASLSRDIVRTAHPLHSMAAPPKYLAEIAIQLIDFMTVVDCAHWMRKIEHESPLKSRAVEAYANICLFFCNKYKTDPEKIATLWKRDGYVESQATQQHRIYGTMVRHIHTLMTTVYPVLLKKDKDENRKKGGLELEKQAKNVVKASTTLLTTAANDKANITVFKFLINKLMCKYTFASNVLIRDFLKFFELLCLRCSMHEFIITELSKIADELISLLDDGADEIKYVFFTPDFTLPLSDFLMHTAERFLESVREAVSFVGEMSPKDTKLDAVLCRAVLKLGDICELIVRLLPLHTRMSHQKERLAILLTSLFSTMEAPAELMLNNYKNIPEMIEWNSIGELGTLINEKAETILSMADRNVGVINKNEEKNDGNAKKNLAKSKKEENIYFKYVRAREKLQSTVLQLSKALNDDRLNFQVANNSIGLRDFRLNLRVLEKRIASPVDDTPAPKRRRPQKVATRAAADDEEDRENEEEEGGDISITY